MNVLVSQNYLSMYCVSCFYAFLYNSCISKHIRIQKISVLVCTKKSSALRQLQATRDKLVIIIFRIIKKKKKKRS